MTQKEYDDKMMLVNMQMQAEINPLRNQLELLEKEKSIINQQMDALRMKSRELGSSYMSLCLQIKDIKTKYNVKKHELYNDRPRHEVRDVELAMKEE